MGTAALALFAFAIAPSAALAATDPTDAQYSSSLDQISAGGGGGAGPGSASGDAAGGLPFTGLDVGLLAVVAAGLLLAGLVLRRHRAAAPKA